MEGRGYSRFQSPVEDSYPADDYGRRRVFPAVLRFQSPVEDSYPADSEARRYGLDESASFNPLSRIHTLLTGRDSGDPRCPIGAPVSIPCRGFIPC